MRMSVHILTSAHHQSHHARRLQHCFEIMNGCCDHMSPPCRRHWHALRHMLRHRRHWRCTAACIPLLHASLCCSQADASKSDLQLTPNQHALMWRASILCSHESIDKKGWAFLLPTVSAEDAKKHFPDMHSCKVCASSITPPQHASLKRLSTWLQNVMA